MKFLRSCYILTTNHYIKDSKVNWNLIGCWPTNQFEEKLFKLLNLLMTYYTNVLFQGLQFLNNQSLLRHQSKLKSYWLLRVGHPKITINRRRDRESFNQRHHVKSGFVLRCLADVIVVWSSKKALGSRSDTFSSTISWWSQSLIYFYYDKTAATTTTTTSFFKDMSVFSSSMVHI